MPVRAEREYRTVRSFECRAFEDNEFIVEGYASTFEPYLMWEYEGVKYYERIEPTAFDEADLSDVIFQRDHCGNVMARTSNGTIQLNVDAHGLHHRTDLSKTTRAREMHEEIKTEMYREMSFAFVVREDSFDKDTHTRIIRKIKKVYDISAVSFGANPTTEISARSYFDGVIERERQELARVEREKKLLELKLRMEN